MNITMEELQKVYADKLRTTLSHDAAFCKACWVAYNAGRDEQLKTTEKVKETSRETR